MPSFPPPRDRDVPPVGDASLSALLAGQGPRPGSPHELYWLAEALAGLTGQGAGDELAGEAETLAAFRDQFGAAGAAHPRLPRARPRSRRSMWVAAIAVCCGLGGVATAAYAGALPATEQRIAHDLIGAPEPATQPSIPPARTRPATSAPSGAASHPGASPSGKPQPAPAHGSGKPAEHPTPHASGKPSAHPTPHGSGKPSEHPTPSAHPTPHGSGKRGEQPAGRPSRQS